MPVQHFNHSGEMITGYSLVGTSEGMGCKQSVFEADVLEAGKLGTLKDLCNFDQIEMAKYLGQSISFWDVTGKQCLQPTKGSLTVFYTMWTVGCVCYLPGKHMVPGCTMRKRQAADAA